MESTDKYILDSGLAAWVGFVLLRGVPALITMATLVLVLLRVLIAWREWRQG